jgi:triphosphoribosyl-dephospho-CoA synthetase
MSRFLLRRRRRPRLQKKLLSKSKKTERRGLRKKVSRRVSGMTMRRKKINLTKKSQMLRTMLMEESQREGKKQLKKYLSQHLSQSSTFMLMESQMMTLISSISKRGSSSMLKKTKRVLASLTV